MSTEVDDINIGFRVAFLQKFADEGYSLEDIGRAFCNIVGKSPQEIVDAIRSVKDEPYKIKEDLKHGIEKSSAETAGAETVKVLGEGTMGVGGEILNKGVMIGLGAPLGLGLLGGYFGTKFLRPTPINLSASIKNRDYIKALKQKAINRDLLNRVAANQGSEVLPLANHSTIEDFGNKDPYAGYT